MFAPGTFRFENAHFDEASATATLVYRFDDGPLLQETLTFPGARLPLDEHRRQALDRALCCLHLAAGVSYYKAGIPPKIECANGPLPRTVADFFESFYTNGLGEFAWRNDLDLYGRIRFPRDPGLQWEPLGTALPEGTVVPMGGGKDSIVALEMVRDAGIEPTLISIGSSPLIRAVAERTGLAHIRIERRLAPELMELNRLGAWNGHVPITGIIAFILAAAGVLYGFNTVVMANERSASSATLTTPEGSEVNHQWSKGLSFEKAFSDFVSAHMIPGFEYFSLLRPLSELAIARRFAGQQRYFDVFSSCNRNFTQAPAAPEERWCRQCPKCRFVFLMLAPFIEREKLVAMIGADLLDDMGQAHGFDELIGLANHKPFECVGETRESLAAFCLLARSDQWCDAAVVRRFAREVLPGLGDPSALIEEALAVGGPDRIPRRFRGIVDAA